MLSVWPKIFKMPNRIFASPDTAQRTTVHLFIQIYKYSRKSRWSWKITLLRQGDFLWLHWQIYSPDVHKQGQCQWGAAQYQSATRWEDWSETISPSSISTWTSALVCSSASLPVCFQFPAVLLLSSRPPRPFNPKPLRHTERSRG